MENQIGFVGREKLTLEILARSWLFSIPHRADAGNSRNHIRNHKRQSHPKDAPSGKIASQDGVAVINGDQDAPDDGRAFERAPDDGALGGQLQPRFHWRRLWSVRKRIARLCCQNALRNFHSAVFTQQRKTSATLHAWAMQPRGRKGGSASKISLMEPTQPASRCGVKPSRNFRAPARSSG